MEIINSVSWFKKYQPQTAEDYVFESEDDKHLVKTWIDDGRIPGNVLLFGKAGTGKSALATILIRHIIKSQYDLNKLKDKKAATFDELHVWCQKTPVKSKQKIIFIEEIDRASPAAFNALKDELMEKYQSHVSFISTTNYINRIDHAVQTRFNFKFHLGQGNLAGTYDRLSYILEQENIKYEVSDLANFIENNISIGLRDMINTLQIYSKDNYIDFANIKIQRSEQEIDVIQNVANIISTLMQTTNLNDKKIATQRPLNSSIAPYYTAIVELINYNTEINYNTIYLELMENVNYAPLIIIIDRYLNSSDYAKFPHVKFLAFLSEVIRCLVDMSL